MKGATSTNIIIPKAEGFLTVPTIEQGESIDIKCFYSPDFTSTLLSDNDVLLANPYNKHYVGQSMLKFFEPDEVHDLPAAEKTKVQNQQLDQVTKQYDHNFGNCILSCTHRSKSNRNIYIPGIIRFGLCYTMPLLIPPGVVPSNHPSATPLNSLEKALDVDPVFNLQCQRKSFEAAYSYHQQQHQELMQVLDSIPEHIYK